MDNRNEIASVPALHVRHWVITIILLYTYKLPYIHAQVRALLQGTIQYDKLSQILDSVGNRKINLNFLQRPSTHEIAHRNLP